MPVEAPPPVAGNSPAVNNPDPDSMPPDLYGEAEGIDALDDGKPAPQEGGNGEKPSGGDGKPILENGEGETGLEAVTPSVDDEIDGLDENQDGTPKRKRKDGEEGKPEGTGKEGEHKEGEAEEKFARTKDLKIAYEALKAKHRTLETEHSKTKAEWEKASKANPEEVKTLKSQLEDSEKRRNELESRLRDIDYSQSEEYQSKYVKPLQNAWAKAQKDLRGVKIQDANGVERDATVDDLVMLANIPSIVEARRVAREYFGDAAEDMMAHRRALIDLSEAQSNAIAEARKSAEERKKTASIEQRQRAEKLSEIWHSEIKALQTKYPRMFGPVKEDKDGNTLFESGLAEATRLLDDPDVPIEERIKLSVKVRYKAANHDRLALRLKRMGAKLKEAQSEIEKYKKSEPPGGRTATRGGRSAETTDVWTEADREIEALDDKSL